MLALAGSCATTGPRDAAPAAPDVPAAGPSAPAGAPEASVYEVPPEAIDALLLAREQARLGQLEQAEAAYQRALDLLAAPAAADPRLAERVREIEQERDRVVDSLEAQVELAEGEEPQQPGEAEQILVGPEPEYHPEQEVESAARQVEPDWPVVRNKRVLAWIEAYTGRLREFFAASHRRAGRYEQRFREIFAEHGVPQDLVYMAYTESGFKVTAYSRAHARGIFQFIAPTARRYGLRVDWWVDERADPEKSARAAARYLKDLHDEFGDWALALAAYNGGEGRVRRAIRRTGVRDFWTLARRRFFRRETRNYVPAIMAATLIAKNPAKFGFGDVVRDRPVPYETVTVPTPTDFDVIARCAGTDVATLRDLNPELRRAQTPPHPREYQVRVPVGAAEGFLAALERIPEDQRITKVVHRVRRGDTLSTLARRYRTTVRAIQQANGMGRRTLLRVGRVLTIPRGPGAPESWEPPAVGADGTYRVRRGDTLSVIARRFGVSVRQLQDWNALGRSTRIVAGQRLRVGRAPGRPGRTARPVEPVAAGAAYTVRRGDTAWEIARAHGVSLSALLRANGLDRWSTLHPGQRLVIPGRPAVTTAATAARTAAPSAAAENAAQRIHVVRRGDTLWDIAQAWGVELRDLLAANGLHRRSVLRPGQRLVIPEPGRSTPMQYVVRRGDTLSRIARRYGTTVRALCDANDISPDTVLRPGDRLAIR
ncbi:MAG: LysM peptidoglycan-binding domain-containing protein [Acidobacteria bacterium]|nr:MAG: LysM peptidoglycan-binding domain-containing protein [Acidobacteriota bacterium]